MSKAIYKVPGGKLVKVELERSGNEIARVKITGDFFVHPEEALAALENSLEGCPFQEKEISRRLEQTIAQLRCQLIGFSPADIARAIMTAAQ